MESDATALRLDVELYVQICLRYQVLSLFWPFHQTHVTAIEFIAEARSFPFFLVAKAIEIEMPQM